MFRASNGPLHVIQVAAFVLLISLVLVAIADINRPFEGSDYAFRRAQMEYGGEVEAVAGPGGSVRLKRPMRHKGPVVEKMSAFFGSAKTAVGLRPSFSAQVRVGEPWGTRPISSGRPIASGLSDYLWSSVD
jgi:hypothetical protein